MAITEQFAINEQSFVEKYKRRINNDMSQPLSGLGLRSLFKNFSATMGRQLAAGLIQLGTVSLIARIYGPEGNGVYAVALLLPSMLSTFLNLGLGPANVYYLGSGQFSVRKVLMASFKFAIGLSVLGLLVGAASIGYRVEQFFPGIKPFMLWLALASFPLSLMQSFVVSIFQGLQKFREFNIVLLAQPLITLLLVSVLFITGMDNLSCLISAHLTSVILTLAVSLWLVRVYWRDNKETVTEPYSRRAIRYGYKAHLSNILAFVNYKADIFLVNLLISPAAAGVYVIAVQLSEGLWMLSHSLSTVLLPRLSQLSTDEGKRLQITPLISRLVLFVTLVFSLIFAVAAHPLISLIFGNQYLDAFFPLIILLPGIVAGASSRVLANDLAARGRPELNMYTSFLVVTVNVVGSLLLIPLYGLYGASAATTIAYMLNFMLRLIMYRHITKVAILSLLVIQSNDIIGLNKIIKSRGSNPC